MGREGVVGGKARVIIIAGGSREGWSITVAILRVHVIAHGRFIGWVHHIISVSVAGVHVSLYIAEVHASTHIRWANIPTDVLWV